MLGFHAVTCFAIFAIVGAKEQEFRLAGKKTFLYISNSAYYEEAEEYCALLGAIPATIESADDLEQLANMFERKNHAKFWIGLKLKQRPGCIRHSPFNPECWVWKGRAGDFSVKDSGKGVGWSENIGKKYQNIRSRGVIDTKYYWLDFEDKFMSNRIVCESVYDNLDS